MLQEKEQSGTDFHDTSSKQSAMIREIRVIGVKGSSEDLCKSRQLAFAVVG